MVASRSLNLRKLAAIDIAFLGPKFVISEYAAGVLLPLALGFLSLRNHSLWQRVTGLYLVFLGINYVPMLIYAAAIGTIERAKTELGLELTEGRAAMRKYRLQSLALLIPLLGPILAIKGHADHLSHTEK